jgi:enoyl-CoA hydratase
MSSPSERRVVLDEAGEGVFVMRLDRPEARNALDGATARELAAAADELDRRDDLRVGVLTGSGGTFCAGMDLKAFLAGDTPGIPGRGLGGITLTPPRKPLIAAVEGWAVAGGFELLLACDMVVAGRSARFGLPEVKRSLVAGAGGAVRLPGRIPRAIAMEMLLTGDPIDAPRAAELGLVNHVVDDGTALAAAIELARKVTPNGPLGLEVTKEIALHAAAAQEASSFAAQNDLMPRITGSADAAEGARAFAEKRTPRWQGR